MSKTYIVAGDQYEAHYLAWLNQLSIKEWQFLDEVGDINELKSGSIWLFGSYLHNPQYDSIMNYATQKGFSVTNKNQ